MAPPTSSAPIGARLGFEAEIWEASDALRSDLDMADCKHAVPGLFFLQFIPDAFEEKVPRPTAGLRGEMKESTKFDKEFWENLEGLRYDL